MVKKSQLFCKDISQNILYNLLDNVIECENIEEQNGEVNRCYRVNKIVFKKLEFHGLISVFLDTIKEYYYTNKQFYIERDMTYNNFLTIVRQICNYNNIKFKKNILYEKDTYSIEYYISL